jgi:SHS2 domain-containing protein
VRAKWRELPHTADLRLQGHGARAADAVGALLAGLQAVVFGEVLSSRPTSWEEWTPEPAPAELLLVELLGEALHRLQLRGEAIVVLDGGLETGRLGVAPMPADATPLREVKAVTYNEPALRQEPDGSWIAEVTLDV